MNKGKHHNDMATCSEALETRIAINRQLGTSDFDGWVLKQLQPKQGEHILDIGCGTGKFAIPCAQAVGDKGSVVGLDISEESLAKLKAESEAQGLRMSTICARIEDLARHTAEGAFDAALCSYALYNSEKPIETINEICRCLKQDGRLLVVGPDLRNNAELLDFLEPFTGIPETSIYNQNFTHEIVIPACKTLFKKLRVQHFENATIFPDAEQLLEYWRSGGYYRVEAEKPVREALASYFSEHPKFTLHKQAISVLAVGVK